MSQHTPLRARRTLAGLTLLLLSASRAQSDLCPNASAIASAPASTRRIVVVLSDRTLTLIENEKVVRMYTVAVGKRSTPSPTGRFLVVNRVARPSWYHRGHVVAPGPDNPLGTRWIGLSASGYGIHGTNQPGSIGRAASHGCIRMAQPDLEELFERVRSGDVVEIEATAPPQIPSSPAQS